MNGECMNAAFELVRQGRIDHAVAFEPALPGKGRRYDIEAKVRLAARPMPGVPLVQTGFVFDMQALRRESCNKLGRYDVLHSHCEVSIGGPVQDGGRNKPLGVPVRRADLPAVKS